MQYKPGNWVTGFKRSPRAANVQNRDMGLFLNSSGKFEPIDDSWDNLHSGGLFISDDNKLYFRDETNKDIYINSPVDNQITIGATSGVGINTTPAETFHVVDTTSEGGVLIDNTATDGNPILAFGLSGTKTFTMGVDDGDSDQFKIFSGTAIDGTSEFVIDGSGNVGIGTASPDAPLDVQGTDAVAGDSNSIIEATVSAGDQLGFGISSTNSYAWIRSAHPGVAFNNLLLQPDGGNVGIGTTTAGTLLELNSTAPYLTLRNSTHENTEGGRESKIIFEGEQTDGSDSTLAVIQASHDGTSDDQKGDLIFYTNDGSDDASPTERLRIDSAGNVGIKTDDPVGSLGVGSANQVYITSTNISAAGDANSDTGLFINYYGYNEGHTQFRDTWIANGKGTVILTADGSTGNVTANTGNLIIGTAGKGIDFSNQASPAAGMTSELLDHYEEGTFTPTGNVITLAGASGNYTRVGNMVHINGNITFPTTSDTNTAIISGLPFTVVGQGTQRLALTNLTTGEEYSLLCFSGSSTMRLYDDAVAQQINSTFSAKLIYYSMTYTMAT